MWPHGQCTPSTGQVISVQAEYLVDFSYLSYLVAGAVAIQLLGAVVASRVLSDVRADAQQGKYALLIVTSLYIYLMAHK